MRPLNRIIIHCAATPGDVTVNQIRRWHLEKGWRDIGYHYLIRTSGAIYPARPIAQAGAHTKGHNDDSIGICLAGGISGEPEYTEAQWDALALLVAGLKAQHDITEVYGHNDFTNSKTCPNFNVAAWDNG